MNCPKCQVLIGSEFVATYEGKCFSLYCIICGWRPTRASRRSTSSTRKRV